MHFSSTQIKCDLENLNATPLLVPGAMGRGTTVGTPPNYCTICDAKRDFYSSFGSLLCCFCQNYVHGGNADLDLQLTVDCKAQWIVY